MQILIKKSMVSAEAWNKASLSPHKITENPLEIILDIPEAEKTAINEAINSGAKQEMNE